MPVFSYLLSNLTSKGIMLSTGYFATVYGTLQAQERRESLTVKPESSGSSAGRAQSSSEAGGWSSTAHHRHDLDICSCCWINQTALYQLRLFSSQLKITSKHSLRQKSKSVPYGWERTRQGEYHSLIFRDAAEFSRHEGQQEIRVPKEMQQQLKFGIAQHLQNKTAPL